MDKTTEYAGGAKRSEKLEHYRLIPHVALKAEAEAFTEGYKKYCEGPTDSNWRKGDLAFFVDVFDHLINHALTANDMILRYLLTAEIEGVEGLAKIRPELIEHLGHARANAAMLIEWLSSDEPYVQAVAENKRIQKEELVKIGIGSAAEDPARNISPQTFLERIRGMVNRNAVDTLQAVNTKISS